MRFIENLRSDSDKQYLSNAAVDLAESLGVRGIVMITRRGVMAEYVSNCRPTNSFIYAFTNVSQARRTMMLCRGLRSDRINFSEDPGKTLQTASLRSRSARVFSPERRSS